MKTTILTRVPIEGDSLIEGTMTHQLFFVPVWVFQLPPVEAVSACTVMGTTQELYTHAHLSTHETIALVTVSVSNPSGDPIPLPFGPLLLAMAAGSG